MEKSKTIASDELLMEQLHTQDWGKLWLILTARTVYILRNRYGVAWSKSQLETFCRQVITETIDKIFLEKKRKWNIERYPNFKDFITGVVDSHINNTLNQDKKEVSYDEDSSLDRHSKTVPYAQEEISAEELRKQIFKELEYVGASDEELMIFECLADGIYRPQAIRKELGITEQEFHNIWRKFKRKRETIRKKLATHGY